MSLHLASIQGQGIDMVYMIYMCCIGQTNQISKTERHHTEACHA